MLHKQATRHKTASKQQQGGRQEWPWVWQTHAAGAQRWGEAHGEGCNWVPQLWQAAPCTRMLMAGLDNSCCGSQREKDARAAAGVDCGRLF